MTAFPTSPDATKHTDVLILGAGLAGLYTALHVAPHRRCWVVAPDGPGRGGSSGWAQGGIAAALGADDAPSLHAADTIAAGAGLTDPTIARLLAKEGPARVRHLSALMRRHSETDFDKDANGAYRLSLEAAHQRARVARVTGDQAGKTITQAVAHAAKAQPGVRLEAGWGAIGLLQNDHGRICGARLQNADGAVMDVYAAHTVLATGGVGGLYAVTTNPVSAQGAAIGLAAQAGAIIANPEFVQFHPTALDVGGDPAPLATEALRGEGAVVCDAMGAPLVDPLGPRDSVARAVHQAKQDGGGAYLDARTAIGKAFPARFPTVFAACQAASLDPRTQMLPIAPAAHYHMGGVETDAWGAASLDGLWAVGEAACTGAHGANRLASNSLLEAVVFAHRAAQRIVATDLPAEPRHVRPLGDVSTLPASEIQTLRAAMADKLGVVRNHESMQELAGHLEDLMSRHGPASLLTTPRLMVAGALARQESRGAHWRADAPVAQRQATPTRLVWDAAHRECRAAPREPVMDAAS